MLATICERFFKLSEHNTDIKTEVLAGITTFMTMSYILVVNPSILADAGMPRGAVFVATALVSFLGTLLMAFMANLPFAIAPGMGLNAFFAYTVVISMGYTWEFALTAVLVEGIIFVFLSLINVRERLIEAIPAQLKVAVSCGIGLFVAFIGLQDSEIIVPNVSTCVSLFDFKTAPLNESITVVLSLIGIITMAILIIKKVKGGILWGILSTWILGIICQLTGLYVPDASLGYNSLLPDFSNGLAIPSMAPTFFKFEFTNILTPDFVIIMFSFLFVDMFDTIGTLVGVATQAGMVDSNGEVKNVKKALLADAFATCFGALFGTSTATTFVESSSGVGEGGRTGLTSVVTAIGFLLSILLSPIFLAIPSFATAPALIVVGFMMFASVVSINFKDWTESIPAYFTILAMPFTYSISDGIAIGIIAYVIIALFTGNTKKLKAPICILAALFLLKYVLL